MQRECLPLTQDLFDSLHPFSFVTDEQGIITQAGRTFVALHREPIIGRRFSELGVSTSAVAGLDTTSAEKLVGEVIRFRLAVNPNITLRGHVVRVAHEEPSFIFALQPSVISIDQIARFGLTIADFEIGTPLIDWLMAIRSQEVAQAQLRVANDHLRLDVKMSELLQRITTDAFCASTSEQLYRDSLRAVCRELEWDIGHVFLVDSRTQQALVNTDIWFLSDEPRFKQFVEYTNDLKWDESAEFPRARMHQTSPVWVSDYREASGVGRPGALASTERACAVAVQISVAEKPVAVIEFISERPRSFSSSVVAFFSLLRVQLGLALAHQEAVEKERAQVVQLAAASKMATLGELAAGVAHEIKNPLSTIGLIVQILKRFGAGGAQGPEMLQEQVSRINLCVDRIASIVRRLNDFSRESSSDPFNRVPIQHILADAFALSQARFAARGVALTVSPCPAEWYIDCRPSQVSQILLNLIGNAFDAVVDCAERWVTLECIDGGDVFHFVVCDSGAGIPADVRDKIMSPFFTTKPPGVGVGLGLSISAHIAAAHGGALRLDDASPRTRFVLELPKRHAEPAVAA